MLITWGQDGLTPAEKESGRIMTHPFRSDVIKKESRQARQGQ